MASELRWASQRHCHTRRVCCPISTLTRLPSPRPLPPQVDFKQEGEWPTYGNDDDRVDSIARDLVRA